MKVFKSLILFILYCLTGNVLAQNIQVDDTYSAQQLIENVLINSPCASALNFVATGDTSTPGQQSYGYFTNTSPRFPFSSGIVLATSPAKFAENPNNQLSDEGDRDWVGDQDLQFALNLGRTYNATSIEFDFVPLTSQISFDYLFASEEYHGTALCNYSDAFAFLLKKSDAVSYQNLAVIPNTDIPVSVTNIHPIVYSSDPDNPIACVAKNEQYFGSFNDSTYPTIYSGQTVVMTAKATVIPGETYHIKLVIADEGNPRYDSAIFLSAGSFKVGTDIGPDRLLATNNPICFGDTYDLDATESGTGYRYKWFKNNVQIPGETNPIYTVRTPGDYSVEIDLGNGCIAKGEAVMEYALPPVFSVPVTLVQCDEDNDGVTSFNLTKANNLITSGNALISDIIYYESLADAQIDRNPILNPQNYRNTTTNQLIASVTNIYGCTGFATLNLQISNNALPTQTPIPFCDITLVQDGLTVIDLQSEVAPQVLSGLPMGVGLVVEFYASENDAILQTNFLDNNFGNTIANRQTIYARIVNGPDCYGIIPVTLIINTFDPPELQDETLYVCDGVPLTLTVIGNAPVWEDGSIGNTFSVTSAGNYQVTVIGANGCSKTKTFTVLASGVATITSVDIKQFSGNANSVLINYTGIGDYEFSLDGFYFQDSPLFMNVAAGKYTVYIKDNNGCGITPPLLIYVLDYPRYFTPNGDGFNDFWKIENLESQPSTIISIFNRYGKLLKQIGGNGVGWDGTFNGNLLPSDDYWFVLKLEGGTTIKSHFALKR